MEKKIGISVQYDCTGMMESEQQDFEVKFKEEEEFEGGMSSDFFMNYMRKGIEDLIKRFPSHYKAVNNCFKHYEEEKKLDTVNMNVGNQMVSFRGMEISLDDIMAMYEEFKKMMGKVSKKFLEPIKLDKALNIDIDQSHHDDYIGAMSFVSKMLKAKGEDEVIRMLFQAWLVAKEDFVALLKEIIHTSTFKNVNLNLGCVVMSFDGVDPLFSYDKKTKQMFKLLRFSECCTYAFESYSEPVKLNDTGSIKSKEEMFEKIKCIVDEFECDVDEVTNYANCYLNDKDNSIIAPNGDIVISMYRRLDLGKDLFDYSCKGAAA